jgi:CheY-like chemotaxis protein
MAADDRAVVLVVDDDDGVRAVLGAMAGASGYDPVLAGGGADAVRLLGADRGRFAAVLLDVQMPGLDGPQTLAELRRLAPALPAVFVTAHSPRYTDVELAGLGAAVLLKPVGVAALGRALDAATGRRVGFPRPVRSAARPRSDC